MKQAVKDLQVILNANGDALKIDGDLGNNTRLAIDVLDVPVWLKIAMKEVGTREIVGYENDKRVLEYHKVSGGFSNDEVPWCGSFVNWVMKQAGFSQTVEYPARAKSWLDFGNRSAPTIGALAIKSRTGGGHVGFVLAIDKKDIYLIGGNQSNEVNIRKYKVSDFVDFRVPAGYHNARYANLSITAQTNTQEA